ncbi:MAG: hypothetical protein R3B95_07685 [Nitrospirales bacterium]|nr:hypothetical protein [Nitrospirales bacterium]
MHCRSRKQLEWIKAKLEVQLTRCKLTACTQKTRSVYCKDSRRPGDGPSQSFDFLGYVSATIGAESLGEFFVSFSPAISRKASSSSSIDSTGVAASGLHAPWSQRRGAPSESDHYGMDQLLRPVLSISSSCCSEPYQSSAHQVGVRKFKRLYRRRTCAEAWLKAVARHDRGLFVHWQFQGWMTGAV